MPTQAEGINIIGSGLPQLTTVQEVLGKSLETAHRDVDNTVVNSELPISVLLAAVNTFLAGPNLRKDLRKQVRFYSPATAGYVAGQNTLTTLAANTLCLGCVAGVDFGPDGYGKEYRLVYDPTGPLQVRNDASFLGDLVPARWVLVGSEQESTSGVEVYNPLAGRVPLGATRLYTLGGYGRQFEAKQELIRTTFPDSRIPAPTGLGSDEYWKEIPLTQPGYVPFQVIGEALANELVSEGQVRASLYRLTRFDEAEGGLTRARSEFDVFLQGLPPDAFRPAAVAVDNTTGALAEGTYDLSTDTFTPGTPGAGVTVAQEPGQSTTAVMSQKAVTDALAGAGSGILYPGTGTATNGAMTQKATTDALAANATADRNRANHTGTQAISTVSGLQAALDAKATNARVLTVENDLDDVETAVLALETEVDNLTAVALTADQLAAIPVGVSAADRLAKLSEVGGQSYATRITYTALRAMWQAGQLVPGLLYQIYDRPNGGLNAYASFDEPNSIVSGYARLEDETSLFRYRIDTDEEAALYVAGTGISINGNVISATGGSAGGSELDIYDVSEPIRTAVAAGTFTTGELQGTQPTGSTAGQKFTTATYGYEYQRGAGGTLVWCRYPKN